MIYAKKKLFYLVMLTGLVAGTAVLMSQNRNSQDRRAMAQRDFRNGNFQDAYQAFRTLCLDPQTDHRSVGQDLAMAVQCLERLGRINEIDELLESTIEVHPDNWRLLQAAAQRYMGGQHQGYVISGQFQRGPHRGGGKVVSSVQRDRVRALQLLEKAIPLVEDEDRPHEAAGFYLQFAQAILYNRGYQEAWRLQYLSDLEQLPDLEEGYPFFRNTTGAAVDAEGNVVHHALPETWDAAQTDGQRWRWCLQQMVQRDANRLNAVRWELAQFGQQQFGVQTMQAGRWGRIPFGMAAEKTDDDESGTYQLHTLKESETIARLATGIKRFEIPPDYNYIQILQTIAEEPRTGYGENALNTLAQIFENRRQYAQAATYWRRSIRQYGAGNRNWKPKRLAQIVDQWGIFEGVSTQSAGQGAKVEFRFRNAEKVQFTAEAIDVTKLLEDVKSYLKSRPRRLDFNRMNIGNLGHRLVQQNQTQYLQGEVARWSLDVQPRENHFDRRITVTTPLQKPGAYLLTAKVAGGNTCQIVLWVADTAIVRKQLNNEVLYYVADAANGTPIRRANLEFFGYKQRRLGGNRFQIETTNFAELSGEDGQVRPSQRDLADGYQWLVIARSSSGRLAYLGFQNVWYGGYYDQQYNQTKAFVITDRPVYRPQQTVNFKVWVRQAQYDKEDVSQFANQSINVEIFDPRGEKIATQALRADQYGGVVGTYEIPASATLGQYRLAAPHGSSTFRVEEYKKPEFEVTVDAPQRPVMLGETITATIRADYYFGSPVTNATVKYKVTRTDHTDAWYPVMPWDWCYGPGYWWFGYDYSWYPGWSQWVGCRRPLPWWWWRGNPNPPEVVAEQEVEIGPDGTVQVEIDTSVAKALHGNKDHRYTVTAEVRDESRRTIVGVGNVLVARRPFKVFTWVDRGYYRVGDTIRANFSAQTMDNQPVPGKGVLTLLKIEYDKDLQPVETPVQRWDLDTNEQGTAQQQIRASANGQYRLSYRLTDSGDHQVEGGYLFTIVGDRFDGKEFRFNNIELIPDKREYRPGDTVSLQINTDHVGSTVLLFVRPANGVCLPPKTLRVRGKSTVEKIAVVKKDMPNFFVEALTVYGGKVHSEMKEIVVPPEQRVVNVDVRPSQSEYKPGEKAKVEVQLTDHRGENFSGSAVISIYDKSVEYISGGSNVPDIKEFFWKWRRQHQPAHQTSLARWFSNQTPKRQEAMAHLGIFGASVATELDQLERLDDGQMVRGISEFRSQDVGRRSRLGGGGFGGAVMEKAMAADAAAPPSASFGAALADQDAEGGLATAGSPLVNATVRSNFADTALWTGQLEIDASGRGEVELEMPENLTTWKVKAWAMGHGTKVGSGESEVVTRKNLIVRLQTPRFFVQKDEVVLSANVHNYLDREKQVAVSLDIPQDLLRSLSGVPQAVTVNVPADGETRVDWRVKVLEEGLATIRVRALTDEESDAVEMKLPCHVHGMLKTESWAGTVRPDQDRSQLTIYVPAERRVDQSRLEIRYSPTLAGAMVDALPYLADYPYGCTEQTLNRFLPSVITQKILLEMNLDLAAIQRKRTNLNAQEIGDDRQRAEGWKRLDRNPVFDDSQLKEMVQDGVKRLTNMQISDGGWGWFSGWAEQSWPHTTAVVVHGLQIAQANDVALVPGVLQRGQQWLREYQSQQTLLIRHAGQRAQRYKSHADNLDAFVYMVLVDAGIDEEEMRGYLYRDRNHLSVYAKAMYGMALHRQGDSQKLAMVLDNIGQYLVQDLENETAYLKLPAGSSWWYWYGSETEANAYYLKLLARTDPGGQVAPRLVKYLLNNRKHATYWRSTRDTAVCVEAFADYLRASGEDRPEMVVEVWIDGQKKKEAEISGEDLFTFDNKFVLAGAELTAGEHQVEIRRRGHGPVYFNAYLTNFTLEDPISRAGLEVRITRKFYRLVPVEKQIKVSGGRGQALDQNVEKYERQPLSASSVLKSGELVEVELSVESKNDYEYVLLEDMKAAGFEAFDVRSGYTGNDLGAYTEYRDDRVTFFVRRLARGQHSVRYRLRAEIPGRFSALPAKAYAMYAPELKGNSDEGKLRIED